MEWVLILDQATHKKVVPKRIELSFQDANSMMFPP